MILVENLTKQFKDKKQGQVTAVQEATFACAPGRIFGLLGLNGAGKTTILRVISTILHPSFGKVSVDGFNVADQPEEVRKRIGFLPADGGLYDFFTPREILRYFAKLCKYPEEKIEKRLDHLISMLRMDDFADKRSKGLSSGMKQKVCLARAIVHDPPVVIFDEPTNNLDVLTRVSVHDFIRECRDSGRCVLLSTHHMSEAEKLCDDIGLLHKGKLLKLGTIDVLLQESGKKDLEEAFVSYVNSVENAL